MHEFMYKQTNTSDQITGTEGMITKSISAEHLFLLGVLISPCCRKLGGWNGGTIKLAQLGKTLYFDSPSRKL